MNKASAEVALVTGASSGIGLELARCFAADGYSLVLCSDEAAELEQAAEQVREAGSPRVDTVVADLSQRDGARRLYDEVKSLCGTPHFLVNNAGAGVHGDFVGGTDLARSSPSSNSTSFRSWSSASSSRRRWRSADRVVS